MKAKNLVQSWLEVELNQNGKNLTQALEALNNKMESSHTHSRVSEWKENRNERGTRLPRDLRVYMGKLAVKSILAAAGVDTSKLSKKVLNKIVEQLS